MNTNTEIEPFALDQVKKHYERAVKNSPYFCDMLYWMGRDAAADNAIAKQRREAAERARVELARHLAVQHCTSLNVLDKEIKEMWQAMVDAHIEERECARKPGESEEERHAQEVGQMEAWARVCDKAFDGIAVLLRIVDVVRNRQVLGRPS